jgi:hypothetical protein
MYSDQNSNATIRLIQKEQEPLQENGSKEKMLRISELNINISEDNDTSI